MQDETKSFINKVPQLKSVENYRAWARKAENLLDYLNLWEAVEPTKEDDVKSASFARKDRKAKNIISLTIDDDILDRIDGTESARQMWTELRKLYSGADFYHRHNAFQELIQTTLDDSLSVYEHTGLVRKLGKLLKQLDQTIPDWVVLSTLLHGLRKDERFDSFVSTITYEMNQHGSPDMDYVVTRLLDEEHRLNGKKTMR